MLKDLQSSIRKRQQHGMEWQSSAEENAKIVAEKLISERYKYVGCNIVDILFDQILLCIKMDRSYMKLNMFEKSVIQGMLSDKVKNGIKNYVLNMYDEDIRLLVKDIHKETMKISD